MSNLTPLPLKWRKADRVPSNLKVQEKGEKTGRYAPLTLTPVHRTDPEDAMKGVAQVLGLDLDPTKDV